MRPGPTRSRPRPLTRWGSVEPMTAPEQDKKDSLEASADEGALDDTQLDDVAGGTGRTINTGTTGRSIM